MAAFDAAKWHSYAVMAPPGYNYEAPATGYFYGPAVTTQGNGRVHVQRVCHLEGGEKVYIVEDDGYTKMVTARGEGRHYTGSMAAFDPTKWHSYVVSAPPAYNYEGECADEHDAAAAAAPDGETQ